MSGPTNFYGDNFMMGATVYVT